MTAWNLFVIAVDIVWIAVLSHMTVQLLVERKNHKRLLEHAIAAEKKFSEREWHYIRPEIRNNPAMLSQLEEFFIHEHNKPKNLEWGIDPVLYADTPYKDWFEETPRRNFEEKTSQEVTATTTPASTPESNPA